MTHQKPDVRHFTMLPVLGILSVAEITLAALIGGLRDLFPEVNDAPPLHVDRRETHNDVRTAIVLAQALQVIVARIGTHQLEIVDSSDDYIF